MGSGKAIWTGIGDPYVVSRNSIPNPAGSNTSHNLLMEMQSLFNFKLTGEANTIEADGQKGGILKPHASAIGKESYKLTLSTKYTNFPTIAWFFNQIPQSGSLSIPVRVPAVVPTVAPYEINDAGVTAANAEGIYVYVTRGGSISPSKEGMRWRTADAVTPPADATEVQLDTTNNKIVFHAADAGASVGYYIPQPTSSRRFIGGANTQKFGEFEFFGICEQNGMLMHYPSVDFSSIPSIELSGSDASTLEIECIANTVGNAEYPYTFHEAP